MICLLIQKDFQVSAKDFQNLKKKKVILELAFFNASKKTSSDQNTI